MICPNCLKENTDNWPLSIGGDILWGGCQECWEKQCDDEWWDAMEACLVDGVFDDEHDLF
jgi:hypothetical protein